MARAGTALDRVSVARSLREIGRRLSLEPGDTKFRARAYERAARTLERTDEDLHVLVAEKRLDDLPGIGPALAAVITELHETGRSARLERMREALPAAVLELAPAVGLPSARALYSALGVANVDELRQACESGRVREVKGFGPKREAALLERIRQYGARGSSVRLAEALAEGTRLIEHLRALPGTEAEIAGAARRGVELVDGVEIVATGADADAVRAHAARHPLLLGARADAEGVAGVLPSGASVRIWVAEPVARGSALVQRTGSAAHLRRLEQLAAERGALLPVTAATEADVYARLGLPFIPPELREDWGEIEAARAGRLPSPLLAAEDVLGAVHCHTVASDGRHTLLQMARAAEARGFRYLTVTDHSPSAFYANGLDAERLKHQWDEIARVQEQVGIRLLRGSECDITRDGALDWPDAILEQLDVVIVSVHERFKLDAARMTARVVRAMRHPAFKIWGHPLGRLIGRRPPFECRVEEILDALAASRGAVEINGDPHRLDLEPRLVLLARERGLKLVISTDAHSTGELGNVRYGALMARRGWLTADDVLNTRAAEEFMNLARPFGSAPVGAGGGADDGPGS
jgi:DNA polymerase (family 10)